MIEPSRIDYILIWGHGLVYEEEIIRRLRERPFFRIIYYIFYKPASIRTLVDAVYSYDYAPVWHLKGKTKYLETTPNRVLFIFFENLRPEEELYGEKEFRHIESRSLKEFKNNLRSIYNPVVNGVSTHDHVIHASDNERQTHHILKYLGFPNGIRTFDTTKNIWDTPFFKPVTNCTIKEVPLEKIWAMIAVGNRDEFTVKLVRISETPQFNALSGDEKRYSAYISAHRGGAIRGDHDIERFKKMAADFHYLDGGNRNNFILLREADGKLQLADGLHRASILQRQKTDIIKAAILQ